VLLEPEREIARIVERDLERQKTAYRRVRIAFGAIALIGAGALLFGYSKRETLRLASELQRARAEGAASFDKLDTCVAAHQIARDDASSCTHDREQEEERFMRSLTSMVQSDQTAREEITARLEGANLRLRNCEQDSKLAEENWTSAVTTLEDDLATKTAAWQDKRAELIAARDRLDEAKRQCDATLASTQANETQLQGDLSACIEDRDTCVREPAPAIQSAPAAPPSPPSDERGNHATVPAAPAPEMSTPIGLDEAS
jgi:chromosome segregation ATPase